MKISRVMSRSKILTDLCAIRQKNKNKKKIADNAYNILVVKKSLQSIKKFV